MGMPLDLLWLAVPLYLILQIIVLVRTSGTNRALAGAPLFIMVPIYIYTIVALMQQSNLWPLLLLFSSPVALLYVTGAAILTWQTDVRGGQRPR